MSFVPRTAGALIAVSLSLVACGQREDVRELAMQAHLGDPGQTAGQTAEQALTEGASAEPGAAGGGSSEAPDLDFSDSMGGSDPVGSAGPMNADGGATSTGNGSAEQSSGGARSTGPTAGAGEERTGVAEADEDSTGVTDTTIKIGMHVPLTGAAPLPMDSMMRGKDMYWEWRGKVHGRTVEVVVRDDQYNPSRAAQVCEELIQREKVFVLMASDGADQINACSRIAADAGVPYVTVGADYNDYLKTLSNYFAISMTHYENAPFVLEWIEQFSPPSNKKIALMHNGVPGVMSALKHFEALATPKGYEILWRRFQNGPSDAQWLLRNQIEVAWPIMTAGQFLEIVRSPGGNIQYAGTGFGANVVAEAGCAGNRPIDGAMFLMRWPGLNVIDQLDPNFRKAGGQDDIELWFWGKNKVLDAVLTAMPPDRITREAFIETFLGNRFRTNVYPEQAPTVDHRYGAQAAHVMIADCDRRQFVTPDYGVFWAKKGSR